MAEVTANQEMSREEVATYLHEFADKLSGGHTKTGDEHHETGTGSTTDSTGEDSAERMREERTDSAERMRDDESTRSDHDEATSDDSTRERATSEESTHEGTANEEPNRQSTHEKVTFMVGNESATVNPPGTVDFEMAIDSDSSLMSSGTRETVAFELHWDSEAVEGDDELDVQ